MKLAAYLLATSELFHTLLRFFDNEINAKGALKTSCIRCVISSHLPFPLVLVVLQNIVVNHDLWKHLLNMSN